MKEAIRFGLVILVLMILGLVFRVQIGRFLKSSHSGSDKSASKEVLVDRQDRPGSRADEASQTSDISNSVATGGGRSSGTGAAERVNKLGDKINEGDSNAP